MSEARKAFESHVNQYDTFGDEWRLVDSKGYPAAWLEEKMNDNDVTRITCECIDFKRSEGDE